MFSGTTPTRVAPRPPSAKHAKPTIAAVRSRRCNEKLNSLKISTDPTIMATPRMKIEAFITKFRGEQMPEFGGEQDVLPRSLIVLVMKLYCGRKVQATST